MGRDWRLIVDGECEAHWNMAVDSAIMEAAAAGESPPTLRLYRWLGPAVTVGRFQDIEKGIDTGFCARAGIPVVRRPTGGRGILHGGDQTVSVIVPESELGADGSGVRSSYRALSTGFIAGLSRFGIGMRLGECESANGGGGDCFAVRSAADVLLDEQGEKLVGSAQRRLDGVILQQSSIRHRPLPVQSCHVFRGTVSASGFPLDNVCVDRLCEALVQGFRNVLGHAFERAQLSPREYARAGEMAAELAKATCGSRDFVLFGRAD